MESLVVEDLISLDREVARAAGLLARWLDRLHEDPELAAADEPLAEFRALAGRLCYQRLLALDVSKADRPLRDALGRWVATFVLRRIERPVTIAHERAAAARTSVVSFGSERLVGWRDAWPGLLGASTSTEVEAWMSVASQRGPVLADFARQRGELRCEVARRLGLRHPWELVATSSVDDLRSLAAKFLVRTDDVWNEVIRSSRRASGALSDAETSEIWALACGRRATEGWPAHLGSRWYEELFGSFTSGLRIAVRQRIRPLGGASFARGLAEWGRSFRRAAVPTQLPFALGFAPGDGIEHRYGWAFGSLPARAEFGRRLCGLGSATAAAQARVMSSVSLFSARLEAVRMLVTDEAAATGPQAFAEHTAQLLGRNAPSSWLGAFPRPHDDTPARWEAVLDSTQFERDLIERFDVDWFRNPRAWAFLRAHAAIPTAGLPPPDRSIDLLVRSFEKELG